MPSESDACLAVGQSGPAASSFFVNPWFGVRGLVGDKQTWTWTDQTSRQTPNQELTKKELAAGQL